MGGTISGEETRAYTLQALPPQPFDKYTLIGKLGHGGMAEVLLAVMGGKGGFRKLVVLKRLHAQLEGEPGFIDMFLDEARLAAQLDHPHCVQTLEVGEAGGQHFLAMEYLDGQGLERLLRSSAQTGALLPVTIAVRMIADALDGLAYAHELTSYDGRPLGVVHRDVSPQNIFVTYNGVVKLLDFGIAKAESNVVQTRTGVVKGKYAYIAPEQALTNSVDQRADLWSMGVVLWEALTSRRLFKSVNELATLQETLQGEIRPPSTQNPEVPPELDAIVLRALQRDVSRRYQSANEFRADLERWLSTQRSANGGQTPTRASIAGLMHERFEEVQKAHKEKLAACLAVLEVGPSSIQRLVDPSSPGISAPDAGISGQFAHMTPSTARRMAPISVTPTPMPTPAGAVAPVPSQTEAEPGANRRALGWKLVVVGAVALIAVILALVLPRGQDEPVAAGGEIAPIAVPPGAVEPSAVEPSAGDPGAVDPIAADPIAADPSVVEPPAIAPVAPEPEAVEPDEREASAPRGGSRRGRGREPAPTPSTAPQAQAGGAGGAGASVEGDGYLSLVTSPWTSVSLGGRDLGTTPLMRVRLPAGRHVLRLVNDEAGISETYEVEIRPGETTTRRLGLR